MLGQYLRVQMVCMSGPVIRAWVILIHRSTSTPYSTTYITCPADPKKTLGIKLPFLVMIIKNLKKYFTFEVQVGWARLQMHRYMQYIPSLKSWLRMLGHSCFPSFNFQVLDDKNVRRRFRASNYQSTTRVKPFICTMPMRLDDGWNQIQFNLSDFTRRAYGTNYIETLRVQVGAQRTNSKHYVIGSLLNCHCKIQHDCSSVAHTQPAVFPSDPRQLSNKEGIFFG